MRNLYRYIILSSLLFTHCASAHEFFIDGLYWTPAESNNWAYTNSETLPRQAINYKTIEFAAAPGFRMGAVYQSNWDATLSYTRFLANGNDATTGNVQPGFLGSVTAKPSSAYLYNFGQVRQSIDYNILELDVGKPFHPTESLMLHPEIGLLGGWINQTINASFFGAMRASETITNNFVGLGPKAGIDALVNFYEFKQAQFSLLAALGAAYEFGHWTVNDVTTLTPPQNKLIFTLTGPVMVNVGSHNMGALTLQGLLGAQVSYKQFTLKLAYELNDWFNQLQYFDNDTGSHSNDLVLQGLTLGLTFSI